MITLLKAKQNNLQSINLNIPDNRIIVVTGVSGSGKSTLVYEIIYQEARRRYLETFSNNTRQFLGKMAHANVEYIAGLSPAIALEQKSIIKSPHSTIGTITELYDLLRLLFARNANCSSDLSDKQKLDRNLFSFNNPKGACTDCKGLGVEDKLDPDLLIKDESKTIREGAFTTTTPSGYIVYSQVTMEVLNQVCEAEGFNVDIPWKALSPEQKNIILYGSKKLKVPFGKHTLESRMNWSGITAKPREEGYYKGIIPVMEEILKRDRNPNVLRFTRSKPCNACHGNRLSNEALHYKINNKSIADYNKLSIDELVLLIESESLFTIGSAKSIGEEINKTAKLIQKLGLGFLALNRPSSTLSGGETQRLRLVKQVTSGLRGILYVFDEPSVGLHPKDTQSLMELFWTLREKGNTVMLVEHNAQIIQQSDWIIDIGPDAGDKGGLILYNGPVQKFLAEANPGNSKTHLYLNKDVPYNTKTNKDSEWINLNDATAHNLKNINPRFLLNALNVVSGVSGAGKTSLVEYTLAKAIDNNISENHTEIRSYKSIEGADAIKKLISIDQSSIGKTPRSNPATYIGLSDEIRNLFAGIEQSKTLNLTKSHFSFNTKGGRCEKCEGAGYQQLGMQMLGTVEMLCAECQGKQFKPEILQVKYKTKSLADIYSMTVDEALIFFTEEKKISHYLTVLKKLGLAYLKLNQRSSTLSGGEARRIKLAKALVKPNKQHTLYIIDEPSSGLHGFDMEVLLQNLNDLVTFGHTIILVEHQSAFIKQADHLIELGPDSGNKGGQIVFQGKPQDLIKIAASHTAKALRNEFIGEKTHATPRIINNDAILLEGVSTHNLKQIDVSIPFNKLTVITGVSGSGKSSLAFDTLFMEGRQRFTESFSAYMRNRLNINSEAEYENISSLLPTVAVNQKSLSSNQRSTVGTITGIYDKIRLLFSRIGKHTQTDKKLSASAFSFNHEEGACPICQGLGHTIKCDAEQLINDPEKSILSGAMDGSKTGRFYADSYGQYIATLKEVGKLHSIDYSVPWNTLSEKAQEIALYGTGDQSYKVIWEFKRNTRSGAHEFEGTWPGFIHYVDEEFLRKVNDTRAKAMLPIMKEEKCGVCDGNRIKEEALNYFILDKSIKHFLNAPIEQLLGMLRKWVVFPAEICDDPLQQKAIQILLGHIINGLDLLNQLGLGYLTLARSSQSLSGGEGQRVRLASCISQELRGICIVLDEPTTGLHPNDTDNLFHMIKELIVQGNTVVVCEHDPDFIKRADHIIDLGPGAGDFGGEVIAQGNLEDLRANKQSITAKYLGNNDFTLREKVSLAEQCINITSAHANNLKNINVSIPTQGLIAIMGVSGSGKSSLIHDVLYQSSQQKQAINCESISGLEHFEEVVYTQQKVNKITGSSSVMSFIGVADEFAKLYTAEAKQQNLNLNKAHFSPHGKQGKCKTCNGKGILITSLDFLSDYEEVCNSCNGMGYEEEVLSCKKQGYSIADVLNTNLNRLDSFAANKKIEHVQNLAKQLGIDYLKFGQSMSTLSGGEVQRLRILNSLLTVKKRPTLFLMDEPTTGLHMQDVALLVKAFDLLLKQGHSIIAIEHHSSIIHSADAVIEMGPGAGNKGGTVTKVR